MSNQAILPYGGTSGWSGSEASRDRAIIADKNGITGLNQRLTYNAVQHQGLRGLTWFELAEMQNWHHGTASATLSVLNKAGLLIRLKDCRYKSSVYVTPEYVHGREIAKGRKRKLTLVIDLADGVDRQTIIDYINCVALCKLEEDNKEVIHWEWK
jgi:hypothetical protein